MKPLAIDHVAHPSFDALATHRFYTHVMGFPLVFAATGENTTTKTPYLLTAYGAGSCSIDFFEVDGVARPAKDGVPADVRHVGLVVETRADVEKWEERLAALGQPFDLEALATGDVHLYVTDPNGLVIEISAAPDALDPSQVQKGARAVVDAWLARKASKGG